MKEKMPEEVNTFLNFFWVNIPKDWKIHHKYEKSFLFIVVIMHFDPNKKPLTVRRKYSSDIIIKFKDNILDLAKNTAKEVVESMRKKIE